MIVSWINCCRFLCVLYENGRVNIVSLKSFAFFLLLQASCVFVDNQGKTRLADYAIDKRFVQVCVCMHVFFSMCVCVCLCAGLCGCVYVHRCVYVHWSMYTDVYLCTWTSTCMQCQCTSLISFLFFLSAAVTMPSFIVLLQLYNVQESAVTDSSTVVH